MHVMDAPSPLLLGVDIMRDLDLRINLSTGVALPTFLQQETRLPSVGRGNSAIDLFGSKPDIEDVQDETELAVINKSCGKKGACSNKCFS